MQESAITSELKSAIGEHLTQKEQPVIRWEKVFDLCGKKAVTKKYDAMDGLKKEGNLIIEQAEDGSMVGLQKIQLIGKQYRK